jgi:hypothetical protein
VAIDGSVAKRQRGVDETVPRKFVPARDERQVELEIILVAEVLDRLQFELEIEIATNAEQTLRQAGAKQYVVGKLEIAVQPDVAGFLDAEHAGESCHRPAVMPPGACGLRRPRLARQAANEEDRKAGRRAGAVPRRDHAATAPLGPPFRRA